MNTVPDWNANEGEVGYIKNKPFYVDEDGNIIKLDNKYIDADWLAQSETEPIGTPLVDTSFAFTSSMRPTNLTILINMGITYVVYWNGVVYECEPIEYSGELFLGNGNMCAYSGMKGKGNTDAPFLFSGFDDKLTVIQKNTSTAETVAVKIFHKPGIIYKKMPAEYLPDESKPFYFDLTVESGEYATAITVGEMAAAINSKRVIFANTPYPANEPVMTLPLPLTAIVDSDAGKQLAFIKNSLILVLVPENNGTYSVTVVS